MTEGADTGGRRYIHPRAWWQVGFGCSFEVMRILELVPSGKRTFKMQRRLAQVFTLLHEWVPGGQLQENKSSPAPTPASRNTQIQAPPHGELLPLWPRLSIRKEHLAFLVLFSLSTKWGSKRLVVMRWMDAWLVFSTSQLSLSTLLQPQTSACPAEDGMGSESTLITISAATHKPHGMPGKFAPNMHST